MSVDVRRERTAESERLSATMPPVVSLPPDWPAVRAWALVSAGLVALFVAGWVLAGDPRGGMVAALVGLVLLVAGTRIRLSAESRIRPDGVVAVDPVDAADRFALVGYGRRKSVIRG